MNVSDFLNAESLSRFSLIDYSVFGTLLLMSLAIGLYFGFFSGDEDTTEEYLMGGHKMKTIPIAISMVASQLSALSIMTIPVEIYSYGWQYALLIPALVVITLAGNLIFIPVFYHNNIDNCYAYLEMRFSKPIRGFVTSLFVLMCLFFLPVILYIPSLAFSEVTGHNIHMINSVVCTICVLYTMLGGIKAVVWTDVLQAGVMVLSIVLVALYGIHRVGGLGEVWDRAVAGGRITVPTFELNFTTRQTFWNMLFGVFIMWSSHITFTQSCVQRIVSLPSLGHAKRAMTLFCMGVIFIMSVNIFTGIIMYAFYYDCDPVKANMVNKYDKLVPRFVQDVVGHISGMPGVFISCVFSASLSTLSASLNSFAAVVYSDYIRPTKLFRHTDRNANRFIKMTTVLMGVYCAVAGILVHKSSSLFQVINTVAGMKVGAVFGIFSLGMLVPSANKHGALWGMILSMVVVLCIIINTQYHIAQGDLKYEVLPVSTEGCSNETRSQLMLLAKESTTTVAPPTDESFAFYKISFMWYSSIGFVVMWSSAIIISYFTGGQDFNDFNVNLLADCVQRFVPKKYRHTELKQISNGKESDKNKLDTTEWIWRDQEKHEEAK